MNPVYLILIDIVILLVLGIVVYKTNQQASKNKIEALEKESKEMLEKAKKDAEDIKKE